MRGDATRYDKILLLTDLTEKSQAALGYARAMAKYYDSDLVILHVLPLQNRCFLLSDPGMATITRP